MTMKRFVLLIAIMVACIGLAAAVPTTDAVTGITNRQVTFNQHGGAGTCWFTWGSSATNQIYHTVNSSTCSATYTQFGAPLLTSYTYYVKACDSTGCGAAV